MTVNRLHERCLRIIYNDKRRSFENLLEKDGSVSIHNRNLQFLVTEISKTSILEGIFEPRTGHLDHLRCISQFSAPLVSIVFHGTESIFFLGPKIWSLLPETFKNCPCGLCKVSIKNAGFLYNKKLCIISQDNI